MRRIAVFVIAVSALGLLGVSAWWWVGRSGATPIEAWARTYLVRVLHEHIRADFEIAELDYRAPRTLVLAGIRVVVAGETLLSIERAELELAELPRLNTPLLIERIALHSPRVRVGRKSDSEQLIHPHVLDDPQSVPAGFRISDFARIRNVALENGQVDIALDAGRTWLISGIQCTLETPPIPTTPGWYQLVGLIRRPALAEINLNGRINVDTGELVVEELKLAAALDAEALEFVPPPYQDWLRTAQVAGQAEIAARGTWGLGPVGERRLTAEGIVRGASFQVGGGPLRSDRVALSASLTPEALAAQAEGNVLGGNLRCECSIAVPTGETRFSVQPTAVDLAGALGLLLAWLRADSAVPELNGKLSGTIDAARAGSPASWTTHAALRVPSLCTVDGRALVEQCTVDARFGGQDKTVRFAGRLDGGQISGAVTWPGGVGNPPSATVHVADVSMSRVAVLLQAVDGKRFAELPKIIDQYVAGGQVSGDVSAAPGAAGWHAGQGRFDFQFKNGAVRLAAEEVAVADASLRATFGEQRIRADATARLLGGSATGVLETSAVAGTPMRLNWQLTDIHLASLGALRGSGEGRQFVGRLSAAGMVEANLADWPRTLSGTARVEIADGRLIALPIISEIAGLLRRGLPLPVLDASDTARAELGIFNDRVELQECEVHCTVLRAEARGRVYFDRRLDLTVSAVPELGVRSLVTRLGVPGHGVRAVEKLAGRIVEYKVTGVVGEPAISLKTPW